MSGKGTTFVVPLSGLGILNLYLLSALDRAGHGRAAAGACVARRRARSSSVHTGCVHEPITLYMQMHV
jgi:hypothetical protein